MADTIKDVEAKEAQLKAELETSLEAAKVLTPATAEFDEAYTRYLSAKANLAKIPDEIAKAKVAENAEAIGAAGLTIAEAIVQLIEGLKVADLMGAPIIALRYYRTVTPKTETEPEKISLGVVFNPIIQVRGTKAKGTKGAGRTVIVAPDGTKQSLTKFVLEHATEAEKASPEYKYPHTQVDSKPKFEKFCEAHSLTGYTYELPTTEVEAS